MIEVPGKYNTAIVYTDVVESEATAQIMTLCNQEFATGTKIRIMPDVHAGAGCTIGFTMQITDKVCPNLVGVDIGCGMLTTYLGKIDIDYAKLDATIRQVIPYGRDTHSQRKFRLDSFQDLRCFRELQHTPRLERSIGTLGGGNHFIEVDVDSEGGKYLVIHSGSRNLGYQVANLYQKRAIEQCSGKEQLFVEQDALIKQYKEEGRRSEIQGALKKLKAKYEHLRPSIPEDLCYLSGAEKDDYLHDMKTCQEFAVLNRSIMAMLILQQMHIEQLDSFETIHNYINFEDHILRKGAVSARSGEKLLIPINMRDGSLICIGKGNPDWNYSAPHGAGRLMSRSKAKAVLDIEAFRASMEGIFTTSVGPDTIDEAPMAYKSIGDIVNNIGDTVELTDMIKPAYNFKASE